MPDYFSNQYRDFTLNATITSQLSAAIITKPKAITAINIKLMLQLLLRLMTKLLTMRFLLTGICGKHERREQV
jgi:hypothetical protein